MFQVQAAGSAAKAMGANVKLAETMATTTKTMGSMNKMMNPQQVAKTMQEFDMANTKMEMTEEMMNDTLDDILADSDEEEEQDAIVNQVLDEIGIEISGKVKVESLNTFLDIIFHLAE
jgi:charged multivesicular body protein 2B